MNRDRRGSFTELFREDWAVPFSPAQWNVATSHPRVLRGMHIHWRHRDWVVVVHGRSTMALIDLRRGSATEGMRTAFEMRADDLHALIIPPGVGHAFYFPELSTFIAGASHRWDTEDELGCHPLDPELGFEWPAAEPILSERDAGAGSLRELIAALERWQPL